MDLTKKNSFSDLGKVISLSVPTIIAIIISELIILQIYLYKNLETDRFLVLWRIAQLIPVFIFAYISDRQYRKGALVISHLLGLCVGSILWLLGQPFWALILAGLIFNPISVARAALLDNFPQYSSVKLVSITYFALYIPWIFYDRLAKIPLNIFVVVTLILLLTNALITIFLFKDRQDVAKSNHSLHSAVIRNNIQKIVLMIFAFILSQMTIEIVWSLIHHLGDVNEWMDLTNYGFLFGFACAVFYKKLPHMSIITLTYATGFGISLLAIIARKYGLYNCEGAVFSSMSYFTVVAGVYLPFVTDGVISLFNPRRKAVASATIELASLIAVILSYLSILYITENFCYLPSFIALLFFFATFLQRRVEKLTMKLS